MVFELVIALGTLCVLFAFFYFKAPADSFMRLLFLPLCLFTIVVLLSSTIGLSYFTSSTIIRRDASGAVTGMEVWNSTSTLPADVQGVLASYLEGFNWVLYFVLALLVLFFLANYLIPVIKRIRGKRDWGETQRTDY